MTALPTPRGLVSWARNMVEEVARLPWTLGKARRMVVELPDAIDELNVALRQTTGALESMLPVLIASVNSVEGRTERLADTLVDTKVVLEDRLPDLTGLVETLEGRLEHMDGTVSNLGNVLVGAIGTIPGMRRAVRNSAALAANGNGAAAG